MRVLEELLRDRDMKSKVHQLRLGLEILFKTCKHHMNNGNFWNNGNFVRVMRAVMADADIRWEAKVSSLSYPQILK